MAVAVAGALQVESEAAVALASKSRSLRAFHISAELAASVAQSVRHWKLSLDGEDKGA